jgi:hypothetical protein
MAQNWVSRQQAERPRAGTFKIPLDSKAPNCYTL